MSSYVHHEMFPLGDDDTPYRLLTNDGVGQSHFKGETILAEPLTILWIAVPLFLQTTVIFALGYVLARFLKLNYQDAAPSAMIGASNHFEVAIATATILFGLSSGAALATVVGVLIEVPVMLMLVRICLKTKHWFHLPRRPATTPHGAGDPAVPDRLPR